VFSGIFSSNSPLTINNNVFSSNTALNGKGGGKIFLTKIWLHYISTQHIGILIYACTATISDCLFSSNMNPGGYGGGELFWVEFFLL
jgi:hypothetical protein